MNNILEVKNLKVSFRTNSGTVKAVRNISFNVEKGETLAIVGESGSGKSVTSKAILGILAGNSIVESGEIFYGGMDLLKISEEEMCKIRGDKISMIFQDPLSSLDPIVKIGRQITEAMLLKNKLSRKMGRVEFNAMLKVLKNNMIEATGNDATVNAEIEEMITSFDKFNIEALTLENSYNNALTHSEELLGFIADKLYNKILDFALEFRIDDGVVKFAGYSVFTAADNGYYGYNIIESQDKLQSLILSTGIEESLLTHCIETHATLLESKIAKYYNGYLGIDMLVADIDDCVKIHPCVEINLRMNMGVAAIFINNATKGEDTLLSPDSSKIFIAKTEKRRLIIQQG